MKKCFDLIQELVLFITISNLKFEPTIARVKTENADLKTESADLRTENASLKERVQQLIEENRTLKAELLAKEMARMLSFLQVSSCFWCLS